MVIGIFNLIPIGSLDGKRLLEIACYGTLSYSAAQKVLNIAEVLGYIITLGALTVLVLSGAVNMTAVSVLIYIFLMDFLLK